MSIKVPETVGYFRVSTPRQQTDGHAMERYHQQLINLGLPEHQIFWDVESGGSPDRRGYNAVLEACRTWARCVVVPCFDRFNRSSLLWEKARQEFVDLGVDFIDLDSGSHRPIDISTPTGVLNTQIRAAFAEYQRNQNRYASLQGHKFRRQQKKANRASFGYKLTEDGQLVINQDRYFKTRKTYQDIALELIDTFLEVGTCSGAIRQMCKRYWREKRSPDPERRPLPWEDFPRDHSALRAWLSSPVLIGSIVYFPGNPNKRCEVTDAHEPLISAEKWKQVQDTLKHSSAASRTGKPLNPLYGLIYCSGCNQPIRARTSNSQSKGRGIRYDYLLCSGAYPQAGKKQKCQRRSTFGWTVQKLEDAVIQQLTERAETIAGKGFEDSHPEIKRTPEMTELEASIRQLEAMGDPDMADAIRLKQARLQSLIAKAERASDAVRLSREKLGIYAGDPEFWKFASIEDRRGMYLDLIERIEIDRSAVRVDFTV